MTCFIYRVLSIVIHIRRLLHLAVSTTFSQFFFRKRYFYYCKSVERSIIVDSNEILKKNSFPNLKAVCNKKTTSSPLHAELVVFETLLRFVLENRVQPYWVIGVSKLMCVGCHTVIAKAYPEVLESHRTNLVCSFFLLSQSC